MKILAIIGSPKGQGAGYQILQKIDARMKALGGVEFGYIFLKDADLTPCKGCYTCMARGEEHCPLKDGRAAIVQQILAADGIILSSPVYVANVSWLMKIFIDRMAYNNHRPQFHRQKLLTVVNMAGTDRLGAQSALRWALGGSQLVAQLAVQTPPWPQTKLAVAKKERAIAAAAGKFHAACQDAILPAPTFTKYLNFLMMQALSRACRKYLPADYAYHHGKAYYYETKINPLIATAAKGLMGIMAHTLKDIGPGNVPWPVRKNEELHM